MNDLNERIRSEYELPQLDDLERNKIWQAATSKTQKPVVNTRRYVVRQIRTVVIASLMVACLAGVALAAGTGVMQRIFGDDTPAVDRVDQFSEQVLEQVTPAEYEMAEQMTWVPGVKRLGIIKDSEMVQQFKLAPRDEARVLIDDPKFGRIIGVPTVDGKMICTVTSRPATTNGSGALSSCGSFDKSGLMPGYMFSGDDRMAYFGIASDDVTAITFTFRDGYTEEVPLAQNIFLWEGRGKENAPVRITTTRGGITKEAENGFARALLYSHE